MHVVLVRKAVCMCVYVCLTIYASLTCEDGPSLFEGGGCQTQSQQQGMSAQVVVEAEDVGCGGHRVWILLGLSVAWLVLWNRELIKHRQGTGRYQFGSSKESKTEDPQCFVGI